MARPTCGPPTRKNTSCTPVGSAGCRGRARPVRRADLQQRRGIHRPGVEHEAGDIDARHVRDRHRARRRAPAVSVAMPEAEHDRVGPLHRDAGGRRRRRPE